jgi:type I restriction enzyme, S subunit
MSEWKEDKLGNLAEVQTGPFGSQLKNEQYITGGTPVVTVEHIKDFLIEDFTYPSVTDEDKNTLKRYILKSGDIVFSRVGSVDLSALVKEHQDGWLFSSRMLRVRVKEKLDTQFLSYYLRQSTIRQFILNISVGSTMPSINTEILKSLPIVYCSLKEQKRIADILSCLDNKIDNLRRQNETLEKIAQTLFKHWFIDFEFPNNDGKPYKSSGGAMVASELGDIPEGWRVGKLGEEVETVGGGTPSTTEPSYWEDGDIYWYSPTDLTKSKTIFSLDTSKKITKLGLDKSSARLFPKYSILMTSRATIGEVTINTNYACTNQGFITLIPNSLFDTFYLFCWLKTQLTKVNLLASGSTFPELSKSDFRNFDFLIPSNHLVLGFRELLNPLFLRIETNTKQIQTLTKTRDTLLPKLMSGQIRVKD